jgi:repressor LexA
MDHEPDAREAGPTEATVKVFQQRDGHTWLLPRNTAYAPIVGDYAEILGKVVAVLRSV